MAWWTQHYRSVTKPGVCPQGGIDSFTTTPLAFLLPGSFDGERSWIDLAIENRPDRDPLLDLSQVFVFAFLLGVFVELLFDLGLGIFEWRAAAGFAFDHAHDADTVVVLQDLAQ